MIAALPFPDISPELFSVTIFGVTLALRWYALAYIVGLLIGYRMIVAAVKRPAMWPGQVSPMQPAEVENLLTWVILGILAGGRLGYVLFYQPAYYLDNPSQILRIWEGGMSFHGGLIGVVVAAWIFSLRHHVPKMSMTDAICYATPPGLLLGRSANFINAELWGRPTDAPWGVVFPGEAAQACGQLVGLCARHPSQIYEALLEGLILGLVLIWLVWQRAAFRRPGLVAGVFFAGYGLARFAVEFVRQPDAQFIAPGNPLGLAFHVGGYGLTMGQILSVPMIALGLLLILRARARGVVQTA